ncbi:MAG: ABC transporter substrate-binding protein [Thermomicrobiales bacterium]
MHNRRQILNLGLGLALATAVTPALRVKAQSGDATPVVPADISTLPLKKDGQLTIHADQPAYPPFFIDNDPSNGKGFESALAYAIGERLGFKKDQIVWGYTSFNASYAPGPKDFDFYITQVSITDERKKAVDFSDPYYISPLVVVAKKDSPVFDAKTLADLAKFSFGAQVGTTYYIAITDDIKPEKDTMVFDTTADSLTALENGQIDAVILDLESANYVTSEQFTDMGIAGQLPKNPGQGTGMVFEKGSELVPYVNAALASLIADGTRDKLAEEWLPKPADLKVYG